MTTIYTQFGKGLAQAQWNHAVRHGMARPEVGQLAAEFSRILNKWLGPQTMRKVVQENEAARIANFLNVGKPVDDTCASGDYCDANMAMLEAWSTLTGTPQAAIRIDTQWVMDRINAAWAVAKLFKFRLEYGDAPDLDGVQVPAFGIDQDGMFVVNLRSSENGFKAVQPSYYNLTKEAADTLRVLNAGRRLEATKL